MVASGGGTGSQAGVGKKRQERRAFLLQGKAQLEFLFLQSVTLQERAQVHCLPSLLLGIWVRMRNLYRERVLLSFTFLSCVLTRQVSQFSEQTINYWHSLYNKYVFCKWEASTRRPLKACLENKQEVRWGGVGGEAVGGRQACLPFLTFSLPACVVLGKSLHLCGSQFSEF